MGQLHESLSSKVPISLTLNCLQDIMYTIHRIQSNFSSQRTSKSCILTSKRSSTSCPNWGEGGRGAANSGNGRKKAFFLRRTSLSQFSQYSTLRKYIAHLRYQAFGTYSIFVPMINTTLILTQRDKKQKDRKIIKQKIMNRTQKTSR